MKHVFMQSLIFSTKKIDLLRHNAEKISNLNTYHKETYRNKEIKVMGFAI